MSTMQSAKEIELMKQVQDILYKLAGNDNLDGDVKSAMLANSAIIKELVQGLEGGNCALYYLEEKLGLLGTACKFIARRLSHEN